MAINFPDSPTIGDSHTVGDKSWTWDGTTWNLIVASSTDHGSMGGLGDDDHTHYLHTNGSRSADTLSVTGDLTVDTSTLHVDSTNDRVGIGTTSPTGDLDINGNTSTLVFTSPSNTNRYRIDANMTDAADYGLSIGYWDGSAFQRTLTVDDGGNVGIGTTSPAVDLHVFSSSSGVTTQNPSAKIVIEDSVSAGIGINSSNTGYGYVRFVDPDSNAVGGISYSHSADELKLRSAGGDHLTINSSGNVGIGTTSPSHSLDVSGTVNASSYVRVGGEAGLVLSGNTIQVGSAATGMSLSLNAGAANRVFINSSGNVGIGTTSPAVALDVHGASRLQMDVSDGTYPKIGNYYSSGDNLEVGSVGGIDFVVDANGNTGEVFNWRGGGTSGAGNLIMTLNESGTLINYGQVQVRPSGASATMLYCYPTGLSAGARGMTVRGPTDSTSTPIQFETGNSFAFVTDGTTRLYIDNGGISKSGGSFDIQHPLDAEDSTSRLRHGFVESPYNDNIYRGTSTLDENGQAVIDLDSHYGMRDGTWAALNTNPWVIASVNGGSTVTWGLTDKTLTLTGTAGESVQWLVIGERHDPHVMSEKNTSTDESGRLILEYTREWADDPNWAPPEFPEEAN